MKKNLDIILWIIPIALYIANIIKILIFGTTIISSVLAWVCCILLAVCIMITNYRNKNSSKFYESVIELDVDLIKSLMKSLKKKYIN